MKSKLISMSLVLFTLSLAWPDLSRPVLTAANNDQYVAGQLILELKSALRGRVSVQETDGTVLFGVPELDQLNRRYKVDDITKLYRHPYPDSRALELGCDLQYIIQFDPACDVYEACRAYEATGLVEFAEPNLRYEVDAKPNDSMYSAQWHLAKVGAPFAWGVAKGDTAVLNLVIDTGTDWLHPDISANLWINRPEDINGNGQFDPAPPPLGDLDDIDQDANGYNDDVIGFDYVSGEPDPLPDYGDDHGTHCWGNINAVTNNGIGVAGYTWNTRSFAVRAGFGGGIYINCAVAAIYHAVPAGVWAISMSFGGNRSSSLADACLYAWNSGCVLYGSAGNDGQEAQRWPACNPGVENVAASTSSDVRASFSNYGPWVDVTAPGAGILATYNRSSGYYGSMDGTSMSCPAAAAVACWMKSFDPSLTNVACTALMHATCDTMPDPLYRQGKLGAGRVSMANIILPHFYCDLRLSGWRFNDISGNGNGRPDPGEIVGLIVSYSNKPNMRDAGNVTATLTASANSRVRIHKATATFPHIPSGSTRDCSADSFVIEIPADNAPQKLLFYLTVNAQPDPAYPDTFFTTLSGESRVLLVDDDLGTNIERWYTAALDSSGILYHRFDVQTLGAPSTDTLKHYPIVIWFTGDDSLTTLTAAEITSLTGYLDNGGNLIISGKNIAQNLSGHPFLSNYLRAELVTGSTGKLYLPGFPADPITRGDTMVVGGGGGQNNGSSLDGVRAVNGGIGCAFFKDYGDTTVYSVIRYEGSYRLVYFSVPFEAIDHTNRYLQKWTLIRRIFAWFGERIPGVAETPPLLNRLPYVLKISPNPFTHHSRVSFISPVTGQVELRTVTMDGRIVATQSRPARLAEQISFDLDGTGLTNGIYLLQLITQDGIFAQKAIVLK